MTRMETKVNTPHCPQCGKTGELIVAMKDIKGIVKWQGGVKIQHALPNWSSAMREQLMTGYHPACWEAFCKELEDEGGDEE